VAKQTKIFNQQRQQKVKSNNDYWSAAPCSVSHERCMTIKGLLSFRFLLTKIFLKLCHSGFFIFKDIQSIFNRCRNAKGSSSG
jgi:hypothetical protein